LVLGLGAALWSGHVEGRAAAIQREIAGQVVRFHVLADSDRIKDQEIKLFVKERLLEKIEILLEEADSLECTKEILKQNTEYLQKEAKCCLAEAGSSDDVTVSYETDYFPVKSYGDYTFPAGEYEALRVKIGRAQGQNWWCMLYPSLCFEDALHPVLEEKENNLKHVLSDEAYDEIWKKEKIHFTFRWF
jgi:stage II sporulation protein R